MTRRLSRHAMRRAGGRSVRRLPGHAAGRPGVARQALIGVGAGLAWAGGLAATDALAARAAGWRDAAGRALIIVPDPSQLPAVRALAGPDAREVPAPDLAPAFAPDQTPVLLTTPLHDPGLAARLDAAAPGTVLEPDGGAPAARLAAFGATLDRLADLLLTPRSLRQATALPLAAAAGLGCALGAAAVALPLAIAGAAPPNLPPILAAAAATAAAVTLLAAAATLRRQLRTSAP